jgi:hypothetical protein
MVANEHGGRKQEVEDGGGSGLCNFSGEGKGLFSVLLLFIRSNEIR